MTARARLWIGMYKRQIRRDPTDEEKRFIALIEKTCVQLERRGERDCRNGVPPTEFLTSDDLKRINKEHHTGRKGKAIRKSIAKIMADSYRAGYERQRQIRRLHE